MSKRKTKSKKPINKNVLYALGAGAIVLGAMSMDPAASADQLPAGDHYKKDAAANVAPAHLSIGAQRAQQAYKAGWPKSDLVDVVAIGYAETLPSKPLDNNSHLHNSDGSDDNCWLQVNSKNRRLYKGDSPSDPVGCARIAKRIKNEQGFKAWSTVKSGKYLQYKSKAQKAVNEAGLS